MTTDPATPATEPGPPGSTGAPDPGAHRSLHAHLLDGTDVDDVVAVEEPLTIRIATLVGDTADLAVTMRTPGNDDELAVGWLFAEGVIGGRRDVVDVAPCALEADDDARDNAIQVTLASPVLPNVDALDRHGLVTSACGVCGRRSLEALEDTGVGPVTDALRVAPAVVRGLPDHLRASQPLFGTTGGVHAAAIATAAGEVALVREDVGRHNALDKVVGACLLDRVEPAEHVVVLSGRASYELLAKAAAAGVEVVVANGAASHLAVDVAERFGITLVGFAVTTDPKVLTAHHRIA